MRLNEIEKSNEEIAANMVELIKRDCQPYLEQVDYKPFTDYPLFRGIAGVGLNQIVTKKKVRLSGRAPMSIAQGTHDHLNKVFKAMYGAPFRNSVFAIGDVGKTWTYGYPFQIFPIGEFEFLWSPDVKDLWGTLEFSQDKARQADGYVNTSDQIDKWLSSYQTTDIKAASQSGSEIMIRCKSYYAMSVERLPLDALGQAKWQGML